MKANSVCIAAIWLPCVCGCADLLKQPYPARDYFGIEPGVSSIKRHGPSTEASDNKLMLIHTVKVTAPYNGLELIYKVGPSHFQADYYSNWIAEPSALLTAGLSQWLDDSGPLVVVPAGSSARPDWILDCDITRLQIDKTGGGATQAVIAAHMFLIHQSGSDMNLVADLAYQEQSHASADNPEAYAEAFGKAYRQILTKFSSDLGNSVSPSSVVNR